MLSRLILEYKLYIVNFNGQELLKMYNIIVSKRYKSNIQKDIALS